MHIASYLQTSTQLLKKYIGQLPFHHYLKNFFKQHKKYGSKDRKYITQLCYNYYRVGCALPNDFSTERFSVGILLASIQSNSLLEAIKPNWDKLFEDSSFALLETRVNFLQQELSFDVNNIFSFTSHLSTLSDINAFQKNHLIQPNVYLRIRNNKNGTVLQKLKSLNWPYQYIESNTIALPIGYNIEEHFNVDEEIVIQDLSSQRIEVFIKQYTSRSSPFGGVSGGCLVWDCCAGSGGKSILTYDLLSSIELTVSDKRPSILKNLHQRCKKAGIKNYQSFIIDATDNKNIPSSFKEKFDLVIADVPCSGSGTWSRTPEKLLFFEEKEIDQYIKTQRTILQNIISTIKPNGCLLYCTCSVFKAENEHQIEWLKQKGLKIIDTKLLEGYTRQADTLFATLLCKFINY